MKRKTDKRKIVLNIEVGSDAVGRNSHNKAQKFLASVVTVVL